MLCAPCTQSYGTTTRQMEAESPIDFVNWRVVCALENSFFDYFSFIQYAL